MEHQDRYLKVPEVAERLGLEEQTVRRWLRSGKLTGIELGSDAAGWRVPESEVQRVWGEVMRRDMTCRCSETVSVPIGTDATCRCGRTHTLVRHERGLLYIPWPVEGDPGWETGAVLVERINRSELRRRAAR